MGTSTEYTNCFEGVTESDRDSEEDERTSKKTETRTH